MKKQLSDYFRKRRLVRLIKAEIRTAFYMQYWGRIWNLYDRLDRVLGNAPRGRLATYQRGKRQFAANCGWQGKWQFGRYSLT